MTEIIREDDEHVGTSGSVHRNGKHRDNRDEQTGNNGRRKLVSLHFKRFKKVDEGVAAFDLGYHT